MVLSIEYTECDIGFFLKQIRSLLSVFFLVSERSEVNMKYFIPKLKLCLLIIIYHFKILHFVFSRPEYKKHFAG